MKIIEGFRLRNVVGESIVVGEGVEQIDFNKLVTLNKTAAFLWQSVENREFTTSDLALLLIENYDIPADRAIRDAAFVVEEWNKNGLISI